MTRKFDTIQTFPKITLKYFEMLLATGWRVCGSKPGGG